MPIRIRWLADRYKRVPKRPSLLQKLFDKWAEDEYYLMISDRRYALYELCLYSQNKYGLCNTKLFNEVKNQLEYK